MWKGLLAKGSTIVVLPTSLQTASAGSGPGPVFAPQKFPEAVTDDPVWLARPQLLPVPSFPKMLFSVIVTLLRKTLIPRLRLPSTALRWISRTFVLFALTTSP